MSFFSRPSRTEVALIALITVAFWGSRTWPDTPPSGITEPTAGVAANTEAVATVSAATVTAIPPDLASCDFRDEIDRVRGATVLVFATYADGTGAAGTGFHLGNGEYVTAAHVVLDDGGRRAQSVLITSYVTQQQQTASIESVGTSPSEGWGRDLARLRSSDINDSVTSRAPGPDDVDRDVRATGYPWSLADDGAVLPPPIVVRGTLASASSVNGIEVVQFSGRVEQGMSGGPLVDECGTVLAVTSGAALRADDSGTLREGFAVFISMAEFERLP